MMDGLKRRSFDSVWLKNAPNSAQDDRFLLLRAFRNKALEWSDVPILAQQLASFKFVLNPRVLSCYTPADERTEEVPWLE